MYPLYAGPIGFNILRNVREPLAPGKMDCEAWREREEDDMCRGGELVGWLDIVVGVTWSATAVIIWAVHRAPESRKHNRT